MISVFILKSNPNASAVKERREAALVGKTSEAADGGEHVCIPEALSRPSSIKDIARLANVSHSTVSRALRNSALVNAETAEKIQRIAQDSGFQVSAVARGLATRKTLTVGVVV